MIRVIAGTARGIRLDRVPGDGTRPILDRAKTALFDILRPELAGRRVLDMFAGTGGIGIEALSQGADSCLFLDVGKNAIETIKTNINRTGFNKQSTVRQLDAFSYLKRCEQSFDLIFVAPPQYKTLWSEAMLSIASYPKVASSGAIIIAQIDPIEYEALALEGFHEYDTRTYGNTQFIFYRARLE